MQSIPLITQVQRILNSFRHWTERELLPARKTPEEDAKSLFEARFVLVSHGTEPDPILNYGNRAALNLWEMTWDEWIKTPSRLTAEPISRDERSRILALVTQKGFMGDYKGVRISKTGRRFQIEKAIVWNLMDEGGLFAGQAASFDRWVFL